MELIVKIIKQHNSHKELANAHVTHVLFPELLSFFI